MVIWVWIGNLCGLAIDEGIYLTGAERVARGQVPFRDFFALIGPGCFWLYGTLFQFLGASLPVARGLLCAEVAFLSAAIYWLTACVARKLFAAAVAFLFVAVMLTSPYQLYITHRWDSNTFAAAALALTWVGMAGARRGYFALAGVAAAMAAWITPPLALAGLAIAVWIARFEKGRQDLGAYGIGVAVTSLLGVTVLLYQGAFGSMVQNLWWSAANYGSANSIRYGALAGDAQSVLSGTREAMRFAGAILPALLPVVAYVGWALMIVRRTLPDRRFIFLLLAFSAGTLAACYPRFGGAQLWFVCPVFWVLCGCLLCTVLGETWQTLSAVVMFVVGLLLIASSAPSGRVQRIATRVGELQVSKRHYALLSSLQQRIQPGDGLFVYPYLPIIYFITGGQNLTRYSYLQPGMMTPDDESSALRDLEAKPPRWIVWHDFPRELILKNWPNSDPNRLNFPRLEAFFASKYHLANPAEAPRAGYRLLERNEDLR